jgi:hypothetical protein
VRTTKRKRFLLCVFDTHASTAQAQVLITVEVLDHYVEEVQHEVQLQIRFPNSVAIAAECERVFACR